MKAQVVDFTKVETADDLAAILDAMDMKWVTAPDCIQHLVMEVEVDGEGRRVEVPDETGSETAG